MKISNESIEEFLRFSLKYQDHSYEEQQRYEIAAALEPTKTIKTKDKNFLEV